MGLARFCFANEPDRRRRAGGGAGRTAHRWDLRRRAAAARSSPLRHRGDRPGRRRSGGVGLEAPPSGGRLGCGVRGEPDLFRARVRGRPDLVRAHHRVLHRSGRRASAGRRRRRGGRVQPVPLAGPSAQKPARPLPGRHGRAGRLAAGAARRRRGHPHQAGAHRRGRADAGGACTAARRRGAAPHRQGAPRRPRPPPVADQLAVRGCAAPEPGAARAGQQRAGGDQAGQQGGAGRAALGPRHSPAGGGIGLTNPDLDAGSARGPRVAGRRGRPGRPH